MKYSAKELKQLTGRATRAEAETALYTALLTRIWCIGQRVYTPAGYERTKDLVHFTATWPAGGGGVGHSRVGLRLRQAVESNGDLANALVLH